MEQVETKVDVLAVMDFRIDQAVSNWRYHGQDDGPEPDSIIVFRQARAAIAELIEAATELRSRQRDYLADPRDQRSNEKGRLVGVAAERVDSALARVGGGK